MGFFKDLRRARKAARGLEFDPVGQMNQGLANMKAVNATMGGNFDAYALRSTGVPAKASIVAMSDTGMDLGGVAIIEYDLLVTPVEGSPYRVTTQRQNQPGEAGVFAPGMNLNVFIDPGDQSRVTW